MKCTFLLILHCESILWARVDSVWLGIIVVKFKILLGTISRTLSKLISTYITLSLAIWKISNVLPARVLVEDLYSPSITFWSL